MPDGSPQVADAPESSRYEAYVDGALAGWADYRDRGDERTFIHTEVTLGGRGVGGALARAALDDVRARGLRAVPECPFIAGWIRRHPEHLDLVPQGRRDLLDDRG